MNKFQNRYWTSCEIDALVDLIDLIHRNPANKPKQKSRNDWKKLEKSQEPTLPEK